MKKFIIVAELRDLHEQYFREEITYSALCEALNYRADEYAKRKYVEPDCSSRLLTCLKYNVFDSYTGRLVIQDLENVTEEIFHYRNFGKACKKELLEMMEKYGYQIKKVNISENK